VDVAYETLEVEREGHVARVWLNRPARLNAVNATMLDEVAQAFTTLDREHGVRVVVLGGRGTSFSSGADRKAPPARRDVAGDGDPARVRRYTAQAGRRALEAIERCEAITVARIQGHVIGGGVVLALGCDFRIAGEDAKFLVPEVDLGIPLTWGAVPRLIRECGAARAREIVLMCDRIDAVTAERWGLVNRVVPNAELDGEVDAWVSRLAEKPPWAVHMTKTQFRGYGLASLLGDLTEMDGDLLTAASREDPGRFAMR
jgi:enoyl-CoA hydratase/carnithine racemase